jgi:hypothetical protein
MNSATVRSETAVIVGKQGPCWECCHATNFARILPIDLAGIAGTAAGNRSKHDFAAGPAAGLII